MTDLEDVVKDMRALAKEISSTGVLVPQHNIGERLAVLEADIKRCLLLQCGVQETLAMVGIAIEHVCARLERLEDKNMPLN